VNWWKVVLVGLVAGGATGLTAAAPVLAGTEPAPPVEPEAPTPPPPSTPDPVPEREIISDPSALIQVPAGCPSPPPADLAFVGTVLAKDEFVEKGTVRFQIEQVRAGDATPYAVDGLVDVRFGPDSQYIEVDEQYLVSAAVDADIGALASKVSPETLLCGGDAVVGLEDTEVVCPVVDDPVQTIHVDGTPVESGLLTPLLDDKRLLLSTLLVPAAIAGVVLIGLVLLRRALSLGMRGIFALGRAAVVPTGDHRAARVRRHATPAEAAALGLDVDEDAGGDARPALDPNLVDV